jgi:hypothetical protein
MKKNTLFTFVLVAVFGITTAGVLAAQYAGGQADKPKPATQGDKQKPAGETDKQKSAAKPHTMTGCLEKGGDEGMFRLTSVEGTGPKTVELHADASKKLTAHVGHKIAITGTEVDPTSMKKGTTGKTDPGTGAKPTTGEHHMRVDSMKHISATCSQE